VVPQATFLFNDTVARNIAFDAPDIRRDDIVRAANLAVIHSDIMTMPMQYETIIGESGGSLSGGQRQRICLARALARCPRVLLFDEATSELDVLSERAIESMLRTIHATRILIAHRVSTVRSADTIAVFNDGEIVERGTHQQLMSRPALYHEMVAGSSALEGLAVGS
jgi:ABC-type bacteriocin/lantibiotic exporter with double-glycine peptidase domain